MSIYELCDDCDHVKTKKDGGRYCTFVGAYCCEVSSCECPNAWMVDDE